MHQFTVHVNTTP